MGGSKGLSQKVGCEMRDFFEGLFVLILATIMVYAYVHIICDGFWICAFDSSPRSCATLQRMSK